MKEQTVLSKEHQTKYFTSSMVRNIILTKIVVNPFILLSIAVTFEGYEYIITYDGNHIHVNLRRF